MKDTIILDETAIKECIVYYYTHKGLSDNMEPCDVVIARTLKPDAESELAVSREVSAVLMGDFTLNKLIH